MILMLTVFIAVSLFVSWLWYLDWEGEFLGIAISMGVVAGFSASLFVGFVVSEFLPLDLCSKRTETKCILYSLTDNSQASGNFILGSGQIKEDFYYTYLYKTVNNTLAHGKVSANGCEIRFTDSVPRLIEEYYVPNETIYFWLTAFTKQHDTYILIPEKSVVKQIKIDLE